MRTLSSALCLFALAAGLEAQSLEAVLGRMDKAAPNFRAMTADVQMKTYTAILSDTTAENGTLKMQRLKTGEVRAIIDFSAQTDARIIEFLGNIVRIFYPKISTYQDYEVGKNSDVLNQFLLLGFGSSGKQLAQSYQITMEGTEKVAAQNTTKLLLVPKDQKVKEHLAKIEMWVPDNAGYPIQQQFYEPSGNYRIVTYANIVINPPIHGVLEYKLPKGVKKQGS
jgi:outer membrane lipoprotein-sorting protein